MANSQRLKWCARCAIDKPIGDFPRKKNCASKFCKTCVPEIKKFRDFNRSSIKTRTTFKLKRARRHRLNMKRVENISRNPIRAAAKTLMAGIADRCRQRGLPRAPELASADFIEKWLIRQPQCECCGVDFYFGLKNGKKNDASASFDQIVPGKGYQLSNVALICWRCNNIKRNYSCSDLETVAKWIATKFNR